MGRLALYSITVAAAQISRAVSSLFLSALALERSGGLGVAGISRLSQSPAAPSAAESSATEQDEALTGGPAAASKKVLDGYYSSHVTYREIASKKKKIFLAMVATSPRQQTKPLLALEEL